MEKPVVDFSLLPEEVLEEYDIEVYSSYEEVFNDLYLDDDEISIYDVVDFLKNATMQEFVEAQPYIYKIGDKYYRWPDAYLYEDDLVEQYPDAVIAEEDVDLPRVEAKTEPEIIYKGNYAEVRQQIIDAYHADDVELAMLLNNLGTNLSLSDAFQLYADLRQEIDGDKTLFLQSSGEIYDVGSPDLISPEGLSKFISAFIPNEIAQESLSKQIKNTVSFRLMANNIEATSEEIAQLASVVEADTSLLLDHNKLDKFIIDKYREIKGLPPLGFAAWRKFDLSKEDSDKLVDVMVSNIRGIGIDEGTGYYGLKSFELGGEALNLYCEVSKEQEDGNVYYTVYYAVEFDEGDTIFSDWAHTETFDIEELKKVVYEIASADYSEDVKVKLGLEQKPAVDFPKVDHAKVTSLGHALSNMRHEINGAAEFAPELLPLKEKQYAILDIQRDAALNGVEMDLSPDNIFDLEHLDCFWYGGYVGSLKYKGYTVNIEVHGDVRLTVLDKEHREELLIYNNRDNSGAFGHDKVLDVIKDDEILHKLCDEGRVVWANNNWVEYRIFDPNDNEVDLPIYDNVIDNNVLDAFSDVGYYKDLIDEIDQRLSLEAKSEKIADNPMAFIFDDEIIVNDDLESVNGYLWAVDSLVDRLPSSESMENINFYADYNVKTGDIELIGSYYTHVNGEEVQKTVVLPLSDDEKTSLAALFEAHSSVGYKQSCLEIVNEARGLEGKPLIVPVGGKTALSAQIDSAENAKKSIGEISAKPEKSFDNSLEKR